MRYSRTGRRTGLTRLGAIVVALSAATAGTAVSGTAMAAANTARPVLSAQPAVTLPVPTVTSAVFPPTGGPLIRTMGTFTFTVPTPTTVTGFYYVLNGTLGVGGGNPYVKAKKGTATTPPMTSGQWGTNILTVQSVDAAGDVSQPVSYSFYLLSPSTADGYGDLNGDGHMDLVSVSASGGLRFSAGTGDGHVAKPVATAAGVDFTGALISGAGNFNRSLFQDLAVFKNGAMYVYLNDGLGGFSSGRAVVVSPPSGLTAWPTITQLVSVGDITGHKRADLVAKWGDQLYVLPNVVLGHYAAPVPVAGTGWTNETVLGVVDVTGDGIPDLIARDDVTGQIWRYTGVAGGTFGDQTTRVQIGTGLTAARFPEAIIKGDVTGDGLADIWAVGAKGGLYLLRGQVGSGFAKPAKVAGGPAWRGVIAIG